MASKSGKSITTSVPSISIKFHANAEQLEELYGSDDEQKNEFNEKKLTAATREKGSNSTGNIQDSTEGSPLKYLRLNKRSNSTDVTTISDSSPPSDPWKFFSEIKDKIAKSVEDKFTEIKAKNQEDSSPSKSKSEGKIEKSSRENSNHSDSEDLSESSLSRTCGIISTTEGAEMASDEESLSLKNDTPTNLKPSPSTPTVRQRFRLLKNSKNGLTTCKEGTVSLSSLTKMYNVNVDDVKEVLPDPTDEVESGVDVLADVDLKNGPKGTSSKMVHSKSLVLNALEKTIDNIEIDADGTLNIREVAGTRWRGDREGEKSEVKTVYSPTGFVDFRYRIPKEKSNLLLFLLVLTISILYLLIQRYSVYTAGMIAGIAITCFSYYIMNKISPNTEKSTREEIPRDIWELPAIKEYQPMLKYEGWLNEYPDHYDPTTYHLSLTQPVYLKLESNWLRISNTTSKVPKRAMWNEKEISRNFKQRRIYNLLGAKISLLPLGLAKIRHWSKKYPICITIQKDQFEFEDDAVSKDTDDEKDSPPLKKSSAFRFRKKTSSVSSPQRFSKLFAEQDNFYTDVDSRSDTSSPIHEEEKFVVEEKKSEHEEQDTHSNLDDTWSNCTLDESPTETKIYLFGRTDREKEDWFRRLCLASHAQSSNPHTENTMDSEKAASLESVLKEGEYSVFMSSILKAFKKRDEQTSTFFNNQIETENVCWLNAFLGRILFDCMCDEIFTSKIKERIQRKLSAIKLPYFIEELSITELHLGKTVPLFKKISKPILDDRGLWVDMDMTYKGSAVLTLTTKLNLMKLKQPPTEAERETRDSKSAIFNSDVDDSAESSSEDDSTIFSSIPDSIGTNSASAAPVNKNKKLMKMVDKITESKLFQAATDNKYIKRAMEGVSNTELRLKVEVRVLEGTLVLNIPPPPTDRIWIGFRPVPELSLSAHPVVGERNISFMYVTDLIEKKLKEEFQKLLVIPNMEDVIIPLMMSKLPN